MALTTEQQAALANERRWQELKRKESKLLGLLDGMDRARTSLISQGSEASSELIATRAKINEFEAGFGEGLADDFGAYSDLEQAMRAERFAGKQATLEYVKANTTCTEEDATIAYTTAALTARPADKQYLIQTPHSLFLEYAYTAMKAGLIPDTTWESFRNFVVVTPADVLMGM